jgi:hypothetical protein
MISNDYLEYLGEFEFIFETALAHESGPCRRYSLTKKTEGQNLVALPLEILLVLKF